jgi:hypothetical protein
MQNDALVAFGKLMAILGETFNESVSAVRVEAYLEALSDLPDDAVLAAMRACIKECAFFPRPKEIRDRVLGPSDDRAELAWAEVLQAVQRIGSYGWPAHLDDATMASIRASWGSWSRLCETLPADGPELLGWRKVFLANYGATTRAEARDPRSRQLPASVSALLSAVKES